MIEPYYEEKGEKLWIQEMVSLKGWNKNDMTDFYMVKKKYPKEQAGYSLLVKSWKSKVVDSG